MRRALPGELYGIFALPGVPYENLALITGHCMEYTLACIWCYYCDDGLEVAIHRVSPGIQKVKVGPATRSVVATQYNIMQCNQRNLTACRKGL